MANKRIDIIFGVKGGGSISGASGKQIREDLRSIARQFNRAPQYSNVLVLGLNETATKGRIQKQLKDILKDVKGTIDLDVTVNGKKPSGSGGGNNGGGGGGGSRRGLNPSFMVDEVNNFLRTNGGKIPDELKAKYAALSNEIVKQGADLTALAQKRRNLDAEAKAAIEERRQAERTAAAEKKAREKELAEQEKQQTKNIEAETKRRTKEQEKYYNSIEKARHRAKTLSNEIELNQSDLAARGVISPGDELDARFGVLKDRIIAAGESGNIQEIERLRQEWLALNQEVENYQTGLRAAKREADLLSKGEQLLDKYGTLLRLKDPESFKNLTSLVNLLRKGGLSETDLGKIATEFGNIEAAGRRAGSTLSDVFNRIGRWLKEGAAGLAVMLLRRSLRDMYKNVVDLDKAVTDLQVASGKTRAEVKGMVKDYSQLAKELGTTTAVVAQGADTWLRQGYSGAEANELLADSTKLAVLGQMDSKEAATALTSAMKGYKQEVSDAIGIVDKFTAVDMVAAASAGDIATAMSETAVSANVAGISMDKLIGYLTVVKEVTQDGAESVGTFYKTLFARMGNIKAGKYVSDDGEDLNDAEKVLRKNGIALRDNANQFRNFGDVLDEVASKWETYDNVTQHAIATAFSGTRQQEKFFVLMENYSTALEYEAVAAESAGTANKKYTDAYLDSIEARKNAMTAAYESLSQTILNSDLVKGFYSALTAVITLADKFLNTGAGKMVAMLGILAAISAAVTKIPKAFSTIKTVVQGVTSAISVMRTGTDSLTASTTALSASWQGVFAIIGLAVAAITALVSQYNQMEQERLQSNREYVEKFEASAKSAYQIDRLYSQYKKLSPESEKFKEVERQIVDLLGDNAKILKDLVPGTKAYGDALEYAVKKGSEFAESDAELKKTRRMAEEDLANAPYTYFKTATPLSLPSEISDILKNRGFGPNDFLEITNPNVPATAAGRLQRYALLRQVYEAVNNEYLKLLESGDEELIARADKLSDSEMYQDLTVFAKGGSGDSGYEQIKTVLRASTRLFVKQFKKEIDNAADEQGLKDVLFNKIIPAVSSEYGVTTGVFDYEIQKAFEEIIGKTLSVVPDLSNTTEYIESFYDTLSGSEAASALKSTSEEIGKLSKALEEMDSTGRISLETAQELVGLGENYTDAITFENGELRLNTDLLRQMSVAKLEEAKATAVANNADERTLKLYDQMIDRVKALGSLQALDRYLNLRDYENSIYEYGGRQYDASRLANLNDEREKIVEEIKYYRSKGYSSDSEEIMDLFKKYIDYSEKQIALKKEMLGGEEDRLKDSLDRENKALEDQKKLLDSIVEARKKALELLKNENKYQKEAAEKNKAVSDLEMRLATSRLDTSASGRANTRKLEDELKKAREDLDEFNLDHAIDLVNDKLDEEKDENEKIYQKQKADNDLRLEQLITSNQNELDIYKLYIQSQYDAVEEALKGSNGEGGIYGALLGIKEILAVIEEKLAADNVTQRPTIAGALAGIAATSSDVVKKAEAERLSNAIADMNQKQFGWDKATRDKDYQKQLAMFNDDPSRIDVWKKYIPAFHSGGLVGNLNLGDNEVFAKLMKGEFVSTPNQMSNFLNKTLPSMSGSQEFNAPLISISVESVTQDSLPRLEAIIKKAADKVKSELSEGFSRTGFRPSNKRIFST